VGHVDGVKDHQYLTRITDLLEWYKPAVVVMEDPESPGSRRCVRVRVVIGAIRRLAIARRVKVTLARRSSVKSAFAPIGAVTKEQIARALASRYPELAPRLPPHRQPWMIEDARMSIFDAAG
jgi:Holliday junction resolvasome RuvABC endonuclease subunit